MFFHHTNQDHEVPITIFKIIRYFKLQNHVMSVLQRSHSAEYGSRLQSDCNKTRKVQKSDLLFSLIFNVLLFSECSHIRS